MSVARFTDTEAIDELARCWQSITCSFRGGHIYELQPKHGLAIERAVSVTTSPWRQNIRSVGPVADSQSERYLIATWTKSGGSTTMSK